MADRSAFSAVSSQPALASPPPADNGNVAAVTETQPPTPSSSAPAPALFVKRAPHHAALYMATAVIIGLAQGLGLNFVPANLAQLSGSLGGTTTETAWLIAAYMAPNVSLTLLLMKFRMQFGIRHFAEVAIVVFLAVSSLHLFVEDLPSALVVRFLSGMAAAPISSLGFLYMLESFPPAKKTTVGLCLALANIGMAVPAARLISPYLMEIGDFHGLYVAQLALAAMSCGAIYHLPLTSPPPVKVIERLDFVSYAFIAAGLGSFAVFLVLGQYYWWFEAPWLGALLAAAFALVTTAVVIELNRKSPLLDIRWITSKEILHVAGALLVFRFVLAEQSTGANGFFQALGLQNEQMAGLYWIILLSGVGGSLLCATVIKPGREPAIHAVAFSLIIAGAIMDSTATNLTRPEQMYFSQAMIAAGGGLFLPPAVASGLVAALTKGPNYIFSFIIIFLTTQSIGGLIGSAAFGTFVTVREKFHSHQLVEDVVMSDPVVAARIAQLGAGYARVLTDPALRNAQGVAQLGTQATREATVLAYNDAFLVIALIAAFALACLVSHVAIRAILVRLRARPHAMASAPA